MYGMEEFFEMLHGRSGLPTKALILEVATYRSVCIIPSVLTSNNYARTHFETCLRPY